MALRDSLQEGESYFIVEIKSLRRILNAAGDIHTEESGLDSPDSEQVPNPVLCCIDEVLRGTNTVERIAASAEILRCFASTKTMCFAATHDLELTGILEDVYDNYHFSEEIEDGDVRFSYRILPGPSTSCNAIALLNALGYDKAIVEQARSRANAFLESGTWQQ
jgi:DNA mismatch repair ATPase MutS